MTHNPFTKIRKQLEELRKKHPVPPIEDLLGTEAVLEDGSEVVLAVDPATGRVGWMPKEKNT
jgi:hypothetical protein